MVSAHDLIGARAFARKRLVVALLCGRLEGAPPTPLRQIVVSILLGVVTVAAALIARLLGR